MFSRTLCVPYVLLTDSTQSTGSPVAPVRCEASGSDSRKGEAILFMELTPRTSCKAGLGRLGIHHCLPRPPRSTTRLVDLTKPKSRPQVMLSHHVVQKLNQLFVSWLRGFLASLSAAPAAAPSLSVFTIHGEIALTCSAPDRARRAPMNSTHSAWSTAAR